MSKKKSYSPLKMWGTWVGAITPLILIILIQGDAVLGGISRINSPFWAYPVVSSIGFLLGWGIHSLFRSLRK